MGFNQSVNSQPRGGRTSCRCDKNDAEGGFVSTLLTCTHTHKQTNVFEARSVLNIGDVLANVWVYVCVRVSGKGESGTR